MHGVAMMLLPDRFSLGIDMAKKKSTKTPTKPKRRMLAPIWLDDRDQQAAEDLREYLWARTKQDAFLHSLRWVCRRLRSHPSSHRRHMRESDRAFADGKAFIVRLTDDQRAHLEDVQERIRADSLTEAVRVVIRMAKAHFSEQR